jgi:hypothetical protein
MNKASFANLLNRILGLYTHQEIHVQLVGPRIRLQLTQQLLQTSSALAEQALRLVPLPLH